MLDLGGRLTHKVNDVNVEVVPREPVERSFIAFHYIAVAGIWFVCSVEYVTRRKWMEMVSFVAAVLSRC